jgi:nitroreductase
MNVLQTLSSRRSIRKFKEDLVEREKIKRILEAVRLSPSALNRQPWKFILVSQQENIDGLNYTCNQVWKTPYMIVACADPELSFVREDGESYWKMDLAIAMHSLMLAAWEEGLGTCWVSAFNENDVKTILGIPKNIRVMAISPLGYPGEKKGDVKNRKPLHEIIHYEKW